MWHLPLLVPNPGPSLHVALEHVDQPVLGLVRGLQGPHAHVGSEVAHVLSQCSVPFMKIEATFFPFGVSLMKGKVRDSEGRRETVYLRILLTWTSWASVSAQWPAPWWTLGRNTDSYFWRVGREQTSLRPGTWTRHIPDILWHLHHICGESNWHSKLVENS